MRRHSTSARALVTCHSILRWRQNVIRTYLERDVPSFGPRLPTETLRRLWTMLAHLQGGQLNVADLARSLGVDVRTASRYLDLLVDLLLVRRLPPWHANVGKRLVKSPKVYVRDSGLVHALLGIANLDALLGHPVVGASFEGLVVEHVAAAAPLATLHFYRTSGGAEIDLLVAWPDGALWAVEVKRSEASRRRWSAGSTLPAPISGPSAASSCTPAWTAGRRPTACR
jgi:predicted AAA+ superfamily ATPase